MVHDYFAINHIFIMDFHILRLQTRGQGSNNKTYAKVSNINDGWFVNDVQDHAVS